jgi:phage shock protein A
MDELHKQVGRARRRLTFQRFVGVLGWCWFAALAAVLVMILVNKFWPLGIIVAIWAAGALGAGLVAAMTWTFLTRQKALEAALEIDRRFGLKERVSSALAMPEEERTSEAGQAVTADALRRVARLDVDEKFPVRPTRQLLFPLVPALAALLAAWLIPSAGTGGAAEAKPLAALQPAAAKKAAETVKKQLSEARQKANKEGLKDAADLLAKLEERTQQMAAKPEERDKTLGKLNDLSRQLEERRQQLGSAEKMKDQLDALKNTERGPADPFAKALSKGNLQQAGEELKKLEQALKKGNLDDKQKEDLAKQMEQVQKKLDKLVEAHQAAQDDLKKQIDKLRQQNQNAQADKLEKQLQQLQQQKSQMQQLQQMAKKCGQCGQCLKQGDSKQAADAMQQMQADLNDMQKQMDEMEMLDDAMTQIAQAKDQMNCKECGGAGCPACQGGKGKGKDDDNVKNTDWAQWGPNQQRASGRRGESKNDTSNYDSRVRQQVGPGPATIAGMVDGPNRKGNAGEIQEQVEEARSGTTDPLSGRQIPRKHRQYAKEYLDKFREGK